MNAGVITLSELAQLREVSVSMGLMLESSSETLQQPGAAHYECPDKVVDARLQVIRNAGVSSYSFLAFCNQEGWYFVFCTR